MKPSQIFDVMDLARRARQNGDVFNPLFVGPPGVGKSQIVQSWALKNNLPFVDLRIAYMEAPDLIGFPSIGVKDGRQVTLHNIPEFLPHDGEGILLLEEPNRGNTSVMNCLMQLLTDRKIHKYTLPPGWLIVGCINPEGAEYDVNTMDAALKDRFEIFNVAYDKKSFVNFMKDTSWSKDILNFVESGIWNYLPPENVGNVAGTKYISPRTLSKLNATLRAGYAREDELMYFETILGNNVAKDFYQFLHDESPVMYYDIKTNLKASLKKLEKYSNPNDYKNGMISLTVKDIIDHKDITDELLASVVLTIPTEQGTVLIRELEFARKDDTLLTRLCKTEPKIKEQFKSILKYGKNT